jgi:hypothetical protein
MGREFAKHHAVDHSRNEYAYKLDGITVTINGPENYFSIFKRGVYGTFHSISETHLHRYLAEFDFRYNNPLKARRRGRGARHQGHQRRRGQAPHLSSAY